MRGRLAWIILTIIMQNSGVASGPFSVETLLDKLYSANPEAVINGQCLKQTAGRD